MRVMWFLFWSYGMVVADALTVVSFENNATVEGRLANFGRFIPLDTIFSTDLFLPPLRMNGTGTDLSTTDQYDEYLCYPPSDNRRHLESLSPESSSGVVEDQRKRRRMDVEVIQEDGGASSNVPEWTPPDTRGVALLVKRGVCSFEEKARMAIRLNTEYAAASSSTSPLKRRIDFILVYHNETAFEDTLLQMGGPVDDASIDVGLVYISNSVGTYMKRRMLRKLAYTEVDIAQGPYMNENALRQEPPKTLYDTERTYEGWQYLVRFFTSGDQDDNDDGGGWNRPRRDPSRDGSNNSSNDFYWIRFVLFGLLIAAPCLRGVSVWYSAGGRIRCVRNERGCMVGLEIIRPANPHWLTQNNNNNGSRRSSRRIRLTQQQVLALPEIEYNTPLPQSQPSSTEIFNDEEPIGVDKMDANIAVHDVNADCVESETVSNGTILNDGSNNTLSVNEEGGGEPDSLLTTCTACSICIDDFETGEKLRLLPRCRHAFHTDCIMPWLTERQGCCPLCKTLVREEDEPNDETTEQPHSSTPAGNTEDQDSIHEEEDEDIELQA
eukprot:scaffold170191_cov54-Attheya_sp.AAC.3